MGLIESVADPDLAFTEGRKKGLHLLKYQRLSATIVGCHRKVFTFVGLNVAIFVGRTMRFSREYHSLKARYIIDSENI